MAVKHRRCGWRGRGPVVMIRRHESRFAPFSLAGHYLRHVVAGLRRLLCLPVESVGRRPFATSRIGRAAHRRRRELAARGPRSGERPHSGRTGPRYGDFSRFECFARRGCRLADYHQREEATGKRRFGLIASISILFYALGKFTSGMVCDFVGGRRMFLFGMFASVLCTVHVRHGDRFCRHARAMERQPPRAIDGLERPGKGRLALVSGGRHGTIFGMLTLSYLFGDAIARLGLGMLWPWGWDGGACSS